MADDPEPEFANFIKVSFRDDVGKLAGKLAWNARRNEHQPILASGPAAIDCAVQALASARRYLGEDDPPTELLCQPAYRDATMGSSLALYLSSSRFRKGGAATANEVQFTVSKRSKPAIVAGAIAARAREGIGATLVAIGPEAVTAAMLAVCRARIYLEDDKLDVTVVVEVERLKKEGRDGKVAQLESVVVRVYVGET